MENKRLMAIIISLPVIIILSFLAAGINLREIYTVLFPAAFLVRVIIPAIILYFVIKFAVKHAVQELKKEGTI